MINRYLLFAITNLLCFWANSQDLYTKSGWTTNPQYSDILENNKKESIVGITSEEKFEYYYSPSGDLELLHLIHRQFRLNTDDAINAFNKISVTLSNVIEIVDIKARVIKPNGKTVDFDKNNIKEIQSEQGKNNYKIFAIDGIEKGDDIEYYILRKMYGSNFGRYYYQFEYPIQKILFELISPKNLIFEAKGYNGFPNPESSVLEDGRNVLRCEFFNMPELKDEKYAYFNPRRARLDYRLSYNSVRGQAKLLTWSDASQRVYEMFYLDKNAKKIDKWIKTISIKDGTNLTKTTQVEEYIKSNIYIQDFHVPDFDDFEYILKNKVSSVRGVVGLYVNIFKALGIKHEIVLTSDRTDVKFDPDFQSWNYLDKYLIYLPEFDKYIDPENRAYRLGCVDGDLTATNGLFIGIVKIGDFESAVGKIKYIKPTSYEQNYDNLDIDISINPENGETKVLTTRGFKGLSGGYFNILYKSMESENQQKFLKELMNSKSPDAEYVTLNVHDKSNIEFIKNAEFLIFSEFLTKAFTQVAGNKILLNVGESIGPQTEMYFTEERKVVGEYSNNRWYYRKIRVNVPEGYKIVNPEASKFYFVEKSGDRNIYGFISDYSYENNVYTIIIDEYYKEIFTALEHFEGFKNVVNAAADFNKVILVLEKIEK